MSHFSNDGNAPTKDELMTCPDCGVIVDCGDERIEFKEYICDECYESRVMTIKLAEIQENENDLFI